MTEGEKTLVVIGGRYTPFQPIKRAKVGDFRVQDDFGGTVEHYLRQMRRSLLRNMP